MASAYTQIHAHASSAHHIVVQTVAIAVYMADLVWRLLLCLFFLGGECALHTHYTLYTCVRFSRFHSLAIIRPLFVVRIYAWKLSCVINIIRPNLSYCVCIFDSRLFQRLLILVNDKPIAAIAGKTTTATAKRTAERVMFFFIAPHTMLSVHKTNHIIPIYFDEREKMERKGIVHACVRADDVLVLSSFGRNIYRNG